MRRAATLLAVLAAGPAAATQEYILPTLFDVAGVAADDVLNVRAGPGTGHEVVGTLAPDATGIEVVAHSEDGRWGRVNVGERSGWASLAYLAYRTDVWTDGELPDGLRCLGTEPFWALEFSDGSLVWSTPETERSLPLETVLSSGTFRSPRRVFSGTDEAGRLLTSMVPMACSDGMSDRAFGLDATVVIEGDDSSRMLTGCCTIGR